MQYKLNKAISLFEVLVAVAILSTAIVFIFRSFTASIAAAKLSQNMTLAVLTAEGGLSQITEAYSGDTPLSGIDCGKNFSCDYKITDTAIVGLKKLDFSISWQENKNKKYTINIPTYLLPKKQ